MLCLPSASAIRRVEVPLLVSVKKRQAMSRFLPRAILIVLFLVIARAGLAEEISLTKDGGVYTLPVEINDALTLNFIFDSGASDVLIPADVVLTLMRTGTITDADFLPGKTYTLADGSEVKSPRFIISTLRIGNRKIRKIVAGVGPVASSPLLGQSALHQLGTWAIDTHKQVLLIDSVYPPQPQSSFPKKQPGWSTNPGAFERHLIRRYNNPLFAPERREITHAEIDEAKAQDARDIQRLDENWNRLIAEIRALPEKITSSTVDDLRERIDELIQIGLGIGGHAHGITSKAKELRQMLIQTWAKGLEGHPDAKLALEKSERFNQEYGARFENPFVAELSRENSPIPEEEIIASLLTEKPETIAIVLSFSEPDPRQSIRQSAIALLRGAIEEGVTFDNLREILKVLQSEQ